MGSESGRPGQAHAKRRQHAAGPRSITATTRAAIGPGTAPVSVPAQRGPAAVEARGRKEAGAGARAAAACGYLLAGVLSFVPPAMICLLSRRDAAFLRAHSIQAVNAAFTTLLYALSGTILAGILALDSLRLGLQVGATAVMFCWLVTFGYLIAAACAAVRGRFYQIPRCLCADLIKP